MIRVVEVERGDRFGFADKRVEVAEHRRGGRERVCWEGSCGILKLYEGQRVPRHAGIYYGEAVFAQLGGYTFTLGVIVFGVALRSDHQIGRCVQGGAGVRLRVSTWIKARRFRGILRGLRTIRAI